MIIETGIIHNNNRNVLEDGKDQKKNINNIKTRYVDIIAAIDPSIWMI